MRRGEPSQEERRWQLGPGARLAQQPSFWPGTCWRASGQAPYELSASLSLSVKWGAHDRVLSDIRRVLHRPPHPVHVRRSRAPQSCGVLWPSHGGRWPSQGLGFHCGASPRDLLGVWGSGPSPASGRTVPPTWEPRVAWKTRAGQPAPTPTPAPAAAASPLLAPGKPSEPRLEPEKQGGSQSLPAGLAHSLTPQAVCEPRGLTRAAVPGQDLGVLEHEAPRLPPRAPVC